MRHFFRTICDFFSDRAEIRDSLALESFLERTERKLTPADKQVENNRKKLEKRMGKQVNHRWRPKIVEEQTRVVQMKRRAK